MSRFAKYLMTGLLGAVLVAPIAAARPRVFVRGFYGPVFYGPGFNGWYGPGPYAYVPGPNTGSVKINTKAKDTAVFVDGGFAGTVGQLKTFHLRPGTHNIELRDPSGHSFFQERINTIAGKTVKINPE